MTTFQQSVLSRRTFFRYAGAAAAASSILTESQMAWAAAPQDKSSKPVPKPRMSLRAMIPSFPPNAVLINANENPLGPSPAALAAIAEASKTGGRYDLNGEMVKLIEVFAKQNSLDPDYVFPYAGSSEPLHYSVLAFTGPTKSLVVADPVYEAAGRAAMTSKANVIKVPLAADNSHDVRKMVAADPNAGLIYICNPNNPTGTTTKREDILWALENKPKGSILMVDEAYIHLSDAQPVLDMVAADKDIIVLRTFSKVYGMAGIRAGFAVARPDILMQLMPYGFNPLPVTGVAAARASLEDAQLVPMRKKMIADTRNDTFAFLRSNNFKFMPSESNCFMVDAGRPGRELMAAMAKKNVMIGRVWPIWPNMVRVSVGTPQEMAAFKTAYKEVMTAKASVNVPAQFHRTADGILTV